MKDYEILLQQNAYKLDLETFKNIPFPECEKYPKFLGWLCFYEKTDIVKYCLEHNQYKYLIDKEKLLNQYCFDMALDKNNIDLIDYFLEKKYFTKNDIIDSLDYFFFGKVDVKYLPEIKEQDVSILGNKAIHHVNPKGLSLALKKGFKQKDIEVEEVFFCFENHVDLEDKQTVLQLLKEKLNVGSILMQDQDIFLKLLESVNSNHQCFEDVITIVFPLETIETMIKNHFWIMMRMVKEEAQSNTNYLKNTILLEYYNNIVQEDLQKIKKLDKDFYREVEKVRLYQVLQEKPQISNLSHNKKKNKI